MRTRILATATLFLSFFLSLALTADSHFMSGGGLVDTGPPPPQYCPPYPPAKTGQTVCWDDYGDPIDCAGTGQDGEYQNGVSVGKRFTENGDGTVTDNLTNLIWLRAAQCLWVHAWEGAISTANTLAHGECLLADGSMAGDWRLPNFRELHSLIDFGQVGPALPDGHPFRGVHTNPYWSSTTFMLDTNQAWAVILETGTVITAAKSSGRFVLPVRGPE